MFHFFNINEKTRLFLVETLSSELNADVSAESVSILPWSIRIYNVSIRSKTSPLSFRIRRLRVGFNPLTLWFNRHSPLYGAREIFFDRPEINWKLNAQFDRPVSSLSGTLSPDDVSGLPVDAFPHARITISDGSFVFTSGDSTLVFATRVNGWMDGYKSSLIGLNVEGNVLSDSTNMYCRGNIDTLNNIITADFSSQDCNMAFPGIEILTGGLNPESGMLDLTVRVKKHNDNIVLNGEYRVDNGAVVLMETGVRLSEMEIAGSLNEREVLLESVTGSIWGVTSSVAGTVILRPEPAIELTLNADNIDISRVLDEYAPDRLDYPDGTLDLAVTLQGPFNDLEAGADITLDSLIYKDQRFENIKINMTHHENEILLNHLTAVFYDWQITGKGISRNVADVGSKDVMLSFEAQEKTDKSKRISIDLDGKANVETAAYYADIILDSSYLPGRVTGSLSYGNDSVELSVHDDTVVLEGVLSDLGGVPRIETTISLSESPVLQYTGDRDGNLYMDGKISISGTVDSLEFNTGLRVDWGENLHTYFMGNGGAEDILRSSRRIQGYGQLLDYSVRYAHPESWEITARSDSLGIAALLSDKKGSSFALSFVPETGDISGTLDLRDFPLEWIVDIFVREEFSHRGKITGIAMVDGTINNPVFRTPEPIHVTDMTLAGINRFEGLVQVAGSRNVLVFSDADIRRDGLHVLHADGKWEQGSPFYLDVSAKDVELGAISDIISSTRRTSGRSDLNLHLEFTRNSGAIDGSFAVEDGYFYDIPFDSARAKLSGGSTGFMVDDFTIEKDGVYQGAGEATSGYFWKNTTAERGLKMNLDLRGDLIRALPSLTGALTGATGDCSAKLSFGGTWQDPVLFGGTLTIRNGTIFPSFLVDEVSDIDAVLVIDPEIETASGLLAVNITRGIGIVKEKQLIVDNVHIGSPEWERVIRPGLTSIPNGDANLDFGVIRGRIARGEARDSTLKLYIPGFMRKGETGIFELGGLDGNRFLIGAAETGEKLSPYIAGSVTVLSGDIHYPLLEDEDDDPQNGKNEDGQSGDMAANGDSSGDELSFLEEIYWNVRVNSGSNVNYVKEYNLEFGRIAGTTLWRNEIKIDESTAFHITGRLAEESFRVTGNARSTYGEVTYYGYNFDIEWAELELDTANILKPAMLTGRAKTIVFDDSIGVEDEIFLHVSFIDRESGRVTEARGSIRSINDNYYEPYRPQTRFDAGALGMLEIRLTSNNPSLNTQSKILARLGISVGNIGAAATRAITYGIDNYYFNPLLRPFEEQIKRVTRLDMVKITPAFLGNFAQYQLGFYRSYYPSTNHVLFDRSRIMFGEYFLSDWFISYTGQYGVGRDYLSRTEKGFYHDIGLQYLLERNIRIQLQWNYDEIIRQDDTRIQLRYDFGFD